MPQNEIFLYVIKGNNDPDNIRDQIPFRVSDNHIFFGPGEPAFRKVFKDRFLSRSDDYKPENDIYVVGVNDLPKKNPTRKILWAGKLTRVMTFFKVHELLENPEFESLIHVEGKKGGNVSPLHVEPIGLLGKIQGYRHRSDYHDKTGKDKIPDWVKDLIEPREKHAVTIEGKDMLLLDMSRRTEILKRDVCFLCENIFFAQGKGMPIDSEMVSVLDQHQPGAGVDDVAIFGYGQKKTGEREMARLKGTHLHIRWKLADRFVEQVTL